MNYVSVFDILKIGVGPSSSHTLGPWRASRFFVRDLQTQFALEEITRVEVLFYGSLALTGKGHGTDIAAMLGLFDADPETVSMQIVHNYPSEISLTKKLLLGGRHTIDFNPDNDIHFIGKEQLVYHPNGMILNAFINDKICFTQTYFSVGGGFVLREDEINLVEDLGTQQTVPYNITKAEQIDQICQEYGLSISDLAMNNEEKIHSTEFANNRLDQIWSEMLACIYRGCTTDGVLPGGLNVRRRGSFLFNSLTNDENHHALRQVENKSYLEWLQELSNYSFAFEDILQWISCFAMAVNEENANFGRVVTAPTNGAAGVIPAVMAYFISFSKKEVTVDQLRRFLLTSGVIGGLYKNGATISAAMGGCQAEIGVSSSMAAVALTEALGGTTKQALMAGEIAMEHHLGLTCDPVRGLVQIPCIERNTMGAVKAITAAHLALKSDPKDARVSLDSVINTMWETAQDMNHKYKETSLGGLATNISVVVPEC